MNILSLTLKSMKNRRFTLGLTLFTVAISVTMLLAVERMQHQIKDSFTHTISGTDLIVGARSGQLNLLLYSVFGIGEPGTGMSWQSYQRLQQHPDVAWTIPVALGDSHQGFLVVGTTTDYFKYRKYANKQMLRWHQGNGFTQDDQVVLGAQVAASLGYQVGDTLVINHGSGEVSFSQHRRQPVRISGILKPTGTPIDQRLFIPLQTLDAMHRHAPLTGEEIAQHQHTDEHHNETHSDEHQHGDLNAVYVGVKSKPALLTLARALNNDNQEPLTAILPLVAMQQLWSITGVVQAGLLVLAVMIVISTLLSLLTNMLTGLSQRQREMAILRALGAAPRHIFWLLLWESLLVALGGVLLGCGLLYLLQYLAMPSLQAHFGLQLIMTWPTRSELYLLGAVLGVALVVSMVPAIRAYRMTLSQGMQARV